MTEIQEKAVLIQERIFSEVYFTRLWEEVLIRYGVQKENLGTLHDRDIVRLMHYFWVALPDSKSCRRGPFFQICDLAELIFDENI